MEYSNLTIEYSKLNELNLNSNIPFSSKVLNLFYKNNNSWINKFYFEDENKLFLIVGNAIYNEKINNKFLVQNLRYKIILKLWQIHLMDLFNFDF